MEIKYPEIYEESYKILKSVYGDDANFRDGQYEAIEATMTNKRTLVVQRTGWGKSLVYFMCTKMFRRMNRGFTMVISPLLVLMENQAEMAKKLGIRCDVLNSTVKDRRSEILEDLANDKLDLIFITPETLFKDDVQNRLHQFNIGLFVVDEAHCISDWGHDFRLEYGKIGKIINTLSSNVAVLATTATANDRVINDLQKQFNEDVFVSCGPLSRKSLHIQVLNLQNKIDRYAWLLENLNKIPGTGIIYCLTQRDCDYLADFLSKNNISAMSYYSKSEEMEETNQIALDNFKNNRIKAIVATVKLGMGYDKDDISFVIHYQSPSNIVAYYQQIGRAGRNIDDAYIFLMSGKEDEDINNYFIDTAFPTRYEAEKVISSIESRDGSKKSEIVNDVNARIGRIEKALSFLESEGFVRKDKLYYRTPKAFVYDDKHYDSVTNIRKAELLQMKQLIETNDCYSKFCVNCLDDKTAENCGKCSNCTGKDIIEGLTLSLESRDKAAEYINALILEIEPRKRWPNGKKIDYILENGICLFKYGDPGYGQMVKEGKYLNKEQFCDELVAKAANVLRERMDLTGYAITNVSSLRSNLVADFAMRLANKLGLKYVNLLEKSDASPQKEMENSTYQCSNALNSFRVKACNDMPQKLILVDDVVDSKWTLTVCGYLLMQAGCEQVIPFALADSSSKE